MPRLVAGHGRAQVVKESQRIRKRRQRFFAHERRGVAERKGEVGRHLLERHAPGIVRAVTALAVAVILGEGEPRFAEAEPTLAVTDRAVKGVVFRAADEFSVFAR